MCLVDLRPHAPRANLRGAAVVERQVVPVLGIVARLEHLLPNPGAYQVTGHLGSSPEVGDGAYEHVQRPQRHEREGHGDDEGAAADPIELVAGERGIDADPTAA